MATEWHSAVGFTSLKLLNIIMVYRKFLDLRNVSPPHIWKQWSHRNTGTTIRGVISGHFWSFQSTMTVLGNYFSCWLTKKVSHGIIRAQNNLGVNVDELYAWFLQIHCMFRLTVQGNQLFLTIIIFLRLLYPVMQ